MPTYNSGLPANSTKIRNAPTVLQDNFMAIEDGDSSFVAARLNLYTTSTPSTQPDMIRLYGKDVSSKAELHSKDEDGNVIQITSAGDLGSTSTQLVTSGVSFDASYYYTASNFIAARASISSGGSASMSDGITSSNITTGQYNVIVDSGRLQVDDYQVIVNPVSSSTSNLYVGVIATKPTVNPATTTTIVVYIWNAVTGLLADRAFEVIVIGGR